MPELPEQKDRDRWRFINAINQSTPPVAQELITDPDFSKDYQPWLINLSLSYHKETLAYADNMNRYELPKPNHFDYLFHIVPKRRRFAKFSKPSVNDDIRNIMEYAQCSEKRAKEYLRFLTADQLKAIAESKGET